jgi:PPP family 3-phenylpropionic acid transporter
VHPGGGAPPGAGLDRSKLREALRLMAHPVFLTFAVAASIGQASHAVYYVYGTLGWVGQGIGPGVIGFLWAIGVVAEIGLMLGPGRGLVERIGPAHAVALAGLAGMLRWGLMSLEPELVLLWPVQCLHALTFGLAHLGAMAFIAAAIPPRLQASAQGLYAVSGAYGAASAYWLAAVMSGIAMIAALRLGRIWDGGLIVGAPGAGGEG